MTTKNYTSVITQIEKMLQTQFAKDSSGHDWWHIYRVTQVAKTIAGMQKKSVDLFVVEVAALLHDVADWKFNEGDEFAGSKKAREILTKMEVETEVIDHVCEIIDHISFKGAQVENKIATLEGQIVQDADRLDAIGAIGIARAFAFGGSKGRPMHEPEIKANLHTSFEEYKKSNSPTINHFYEKLLLLKDKLNTPEAKKLAEYRHKFMEQYLEEFYSEWEGKK